MPLSCATNLVGVRVIFKGPFYVSQVIYILGRNKTIVPLALVEYEIIIARSLSAILYPTHARRIVVKVGFYLMAVFPSRNLGLMRISRSRFKQSKNCSFISRIYVLRSFVNFWVIFGDVWEEIVFRNGLVKFREIRNVEDLM